MHVYVNLYMHVYVNVYVYECVCECVYACVCECVYACVFSFLENHGTLYYTSSIISNYQSASINYIVVTLSPPDRTRMHIHAP